MSKASDHANKVAESKNAPDFTWADNSIANHAQIVATVSDTGALVIEGTCPGAEALKLAAWIMDTFS